MFKYHIETNLAVPLKFIPEPLKVGISSANTGFLNPEYRQICLKYRNQKVNLKSPFLHVTHLESDLVVCVPLAGHPVGDRVDDVYLKKVRRSSVCVIQSLLLAENNNRLCKHC